MQTHSPLRTPHAEEQSPHDRTLTEQHLRLVYDTMACGVVVFDTGMRVVTANSAAREMWGASLTDLQAERPSADGWRMVRVDGAPLPDEERPAAFALRTGQPRRGVVFGLIRPDGERRWLQADAVPVLNDAGTPVQVVVSYIDVTERKRAEEALRASEERFRALTEHGSDLVCILAPDGTALYGSPSYTRVLGAPLEELHRGAGSPLGAIHPDDRAAVQAAMIAWVRDGLPTATLTCRHRHADGSWRTLECVATNRLGDPAIGGIIVTSRDVTARVQAEERLRMVVDNAPLMLFAIDRNGIIQLAEGKGLERRGRTPGDYVGHSLFEAHAAHPAILDGARRALAGETVATTSDQGGVAFETRYVPLRDANGAVTGAIGVSTDVTERKRAEEALRRSEERLQALIRNAPLVLSEIDADGVFTFSSGRGLDAMDLPQHASVGRSAFDLYHDNPALIDGLRRVLAGEETTVAITLRGVPFEAHYIPRRDAAGRVTGAVAVAVDVSARTRAEEALRVSEERFRTLIEQAPVGACLPDEQGCFEIVNDAFAALYGYAPGELLGQHTGVIVPLTQRAAVAEQLAALIATGESARREHEVVTRQGQALTVLTNTVQIQGADGRPRRAYFVIDITERARLEAELRANHADLARSNAELQQFASVAAHDLRSPLSTVAGYAQLLQMRYGNALDESAHDYIAFVVDAAQRMQRLIDDLLTYARLETRATVMEPVDLSAVVTRVGAGLEAVVREAGATITAAGLPTVPGIPSQLEQLVQNLIANAVKFRRPDVAPTVTITAERQDAQWLLRVRDNGIGLDPDYAERVFEIFQRLHTREEYEGTGIGLALCKKIVERHGGRIWVESRSGHGATFLFTLPAGE